VTAADTPAPTPRFRSDMTVELVKHTAADTDVLWAARVSTAGEQSLDELHKDPERSRGLINYLMRDRHGSPFEHNSMTFFVSAPLFVFREFHRHRVGWCLAGDTAITVLDADGAATRVTVRDLHARRAAGRVRCYDEDTLAARSAAVVDVFTSGEKPLLRIVTGRGRTLRCSADHAVLTPAGWRKAGELVPGDQVTGAGQGPDADAEPDTVTSVTGDGVEMTYDISVEGPWHNFLASGLVVHNSYNEESGRYRELEPVFYVPGASRKLVQRGRPGKYEFVDGTAEQQELVGRATTESYRQAYLAYQEMLAAGVAREVARAVLPVGLYSSMYATCNARSLMHFLGLRTRHEQARVPSFPQREIEMVGELMEAEWAKLMPLTYAAFNAQGRVAP
jgi:thymidylate synthase ThyX